jgi:hypothetical protein
VAAPRQYHSFVNHSAVERSTAWSAAGGVFALLGVGAAAPLWLLAKHSGWELVLSIVSTLAIGLGLYWMLAALIPLSPFPLTRGASETRYRLDQRRLFARHVQSQLQLLATREDWRDERFADLEAEVEMEGRQRTKRWLPNSYSKSVLLRREKSLSRALERSVEPLIVLEGDPGAGKSVALRHLAERLADKARSSRDLSEIPLYINLKEFRPERRPVDSQSVYDFILASINRVNDRDVERFLDEEFDRGLRDGSWVILLDSFDEIPDILSSTEADNVVEEYALAIHSFLFGMHGSRAIIASREFRGPKTFRVPRFHIMSLSGRRQADLIRRSGLHPDDARIVQGGLATADAEIRQAASNPMFLGLICEYARTNNRFPDNSHSVYESYLTQRFARDAERVQRRYKVGARLVRALAEEIAFSMASIPGLGLSPTRQALRSALINIDPISITRLDAVLDALEYTKLGRTAEDTDGAGGPAFTFAHRRFQEYFATCVVLRNPERVSVSQLLIDGRWRETAVTILQTQPAAAAAPLLEEATQLLAPMTRSALEDEELQATSGGYCWPPGSMHLMGVLSAGLGQTPDSIPAKFRADASSLLRSAWNKGRRHDKKWAVNLAPVAWQNETFWLLEQAFASGSLVLGGAAYTCVSQLADPSPNLYEGVRKTLINMAANGDLNEQKVALNAQVRRLAEPVPLIQVLRLLTLAPYIDCGFATILVLACCLVSWPLGAAVASFAMIGLIGYQLMLSLHDSYRLPGTRLTMNMGSRVSAGVVFVAAYARCIAAFLAVLGVYNAVPRNWIVFVVAIFAGAYFTCWPPAVGYVCRYREGINGILWPAVPLFALVKLLQRAISAIKQTSMSKLIMICLSLLVLVPIGWIIRKYYPSFDHNATVKLTVAIIAFLAYGSSVIAAGTAFVIYIYRRHNDALSIRVFSCMHQTTVAEVFSVLSRIRTARGVRLFIESALRVDLVAYPEIVRVLSDFAAAAEMVEAEKKAETKRKSPKVLVVPGITSEFADWLDLNSQRKRRVWKTSSTQYLPFSLRKVQGATLDEIARSIEQTEVARGSAPSESVG